MAVGFPNDHCAWCHSWPCRCAKPRVEPCVCGGPELRARCPEEWPVVVSGHQQSREHQAWRAVAGWGL